MKKTLGSSCQTSSQLSRRCLLKVGGAGLLGLSLPGLLRAEGSAGKLKVRAKSVIFLHQYGGPSCHDTFDMKPSAPEQIRGEFKPISTNVTGMPICERLPRMADLMNKVTLLRGLHHTMK